MTDQPNPPRLPAHDYLSTACFHGDHDYCNSRTLQSHHKTPAQCKFCAAPCRCACHHRTPLGAEQ